MNRYSGPPMTLGNAAAARVGSWSAVSMQHQVEPDPIGTSYGALV